jgi:hypothetical protein
VSALGAEFESELRRIYDRARSLEEVNEQLRGLRERVDEARKRFEETHTRTASLIEDRFDDDLRRVFRGRKESLPNALAELDRDLVAVVTDYLDAHSIAYEREGELLHVSASPRLPDAMTVAIGPSLEHRSLHLSHPLVVAAVEDARGLTQLPAARVAWTDQRGKRARLRVCKLAIDGFEKVEQLLPVVVLEDGERLPVELVFKLLESELEPIAQLPLSAAVSDEALQDAQDELLFEQQATLEVAEQQRFERALRQADRFIEDRLLVRKAQRTRLNERIREGNQRYEAAMGAEARNEVQEMLTKLQVELDEVEGAMERLVQRDDATYRAYHEHIHQRRYAPPRVTALFDLELVFE